MRRFFVVLAGIAAMLAVALPAVATPEPTVLTLDAATEARTGEPHEVSVTLTDARGTPLAGQTITVLERMRFFDYTDTATVAEVRTNQRGTATLSHTPSAPGPGRLIAEFAGSDELAPAVGTFALTVEEGVGVTSPVLPGVPEPLLPRGVTALWFLPLLLGVWLAIAAALYNALRIPMEREVRHEA